MKVLIPSPLLSYTKVRELDVAGASVSAVLGALEQRFPGLRFRIIDEQDRVRPHMRLFVNGAQVDRLDTPLQANDTLQIIQALSGG